MLTTGNRPVSITTASTTAAYEKSNENNNRLSSILIGGIVAGVILIAALLLAIWFIIRGVRSSNNEELGEELPQVVGSLSRQYSTLFDGNQRIINFKSLNFLDVIGKGSFGVVYKLVLSSKTDCF